MIHLDQDRIGHAPFYALPQPGRIGHKQVVTHQLHRAAEFFGEQGPTFPIIFCHPVLDRNDREAIDEVGKLVDHFSAAVLTSPEGITAVFEKLSTGHIQGQGYLIAGAVAGFFNRLDQQVTGGGVIGQIRSEAPFVAYGGGEPLILEQSFEGVEHLSTPAQGFAKTVGPVGYQHEFLEIHVVGGVGTAVDDVHQGHG